ncbi:MAG: diguanylate cyclase, partial [Xanthomonadaceae bacterium]|nr:diguanylate cyclase [Xanthomonadaceae bacterium]
GRYRFHVRGRNLYGQQAREAVFDFRVLPPWYRTAWAWLAWSVGGVLMLSLLVRWRLHALHRRNRALALLVSQRTAELAHANQALREANAALAQQVFVDPLTGLKNRRYLEENIQHDLANARRHGPDLQMYLLFLLVDLDHFKQINDGHGHASGDRVLQQFRDVLMSVVRESDTAVRHGGEEFLIVARFTAPDAGPHYAERIRAAVAAYPFALEDGQLLHLTCSVGFASYPLFTSAPNLLGWEQVINLADECMYAAKRHDRNAWAGVPPVNAPPPPGNLADVLRDALSRLPEPGALPVAASWACAKPPEAMK